MKKMTDENMLLRALTDVDDRYVEEAISFAENREAAKHRKIVRFRKTVSRMAALAACLVVTFAGLWMSGVLQPKGLTSSGNDTAGEAGPAVSASYGEETTADTAQQSGNSEVSREAESDYTGGSEAADASGKTGTSSESEDMDSAAAVNPYQEVSSLTEAEEITGFSMQAPETEGAADQRTIYVIDGEMIEVDYSSSAGLSDDTADSESSSDGFPDTGSSAQVEFSIRKAAGTEDVSGDYSTYTNSETAEVNGAVVTLKGNQDTWSLATWTKDGYTYAVGAQEHPMTKEAILKIVGEVG